MIFLQLAENQRLMAISEPTAKELIVYLCRKLAEDAYYSKSWEEVFFDAYKVVRQ